ncbi:hypothetical protein ACIREM_14260 [Streptomyces shenzhenensis]|uniref:hypothetical protein n=1 Tax=Streptomyces shenzhenensis TaxID=943815 RepID=UPI00381B1BE0
MITVLGEGCEASSLTARQVTVHRAASAYQLAVRSMTAIGSWATAHSRSVPSVGPWPGAGSRCRTRR